MRPPLEEGGPIGPVGQAHPLQRHPKSGALKDARPGKEVPQSATNLGNDRLGTPTRPLIGLTSSHPARFPGSGRGNGPSGSRDRERGLPRVGHGRCWSPPGS